MPAYLMTEATYIVKQDFIAVQFTFDKPNPNPQTKSFKKGDIITAKGEDDFGGNAHLVSNGFVIPLDKVELKSWNERKSFGIKLLIGIAIVAVIIGILKLFKVF